MLQVGVLRFDLVLGSVTFRRAMMLTMQLVLIMLRQISDLVPFTGTEGHCKGDSKERTNEAFHGAREISERTQVAKCFVQRLAARPSEAAPRGRRFMNDDFGQTAQLR
jgi:hypothetical protein